MGCSLPHSFLPLLSPTCPTHSSPSLLLLHISYTTPLQHFPFIPMPHPPLLPLPLFQPSPPHPFPLFPDPLLPLYSQPSLPTRRSPAAGSAGRLSRSAAR